MKLQPAELALILLTFATGFMLGGALKGPAVPLVIPGAAREGPGSLPSNYDPVRQIANDAIKAATDSQQACWSHLQAILIEKRGSPEVGH